MGLLNDASITALWRACKFMFGLGATSKIRPVRTPQILRHAVAMTAFFLTLAYVCTACYTWLSVTAVTIPFRHIAVHQGPSPMMARPLNQTLCDYYRSGDPIPTTLPDLLSLCGLDNGGYVIHLVLG